METSATLTLVMCSAATLFLLARLWAGRDLRSRMPLIIYAGAYVATTMLGATLIGVFGEDIIDLDDYGLELSVLQEVGTVTYWLLLFAPLLTVLALANWRRQPARRPTRGDTTWLAEIDVKLLDFVFVFAALSGYCVLALDQAGFLNVWSMWQGLRGDFVELLLLRRDVLAATGQLFCGFVYTSLPALSYCALYQAVRTKTWAWRCVFAWTLVTVVMLCLSSIQKSLLLVYVLFLGIGLVELGKLRVRILTLNLVALLLLLTLLQSYFIRDWNILESVQLVVFRVSVAYPYYLNLYPDRLPFQGPDLGLHILGIVASPRDNLDVFNYMYPSVSRIQGCAAAAAHVRAYSQAGLFFALMTSVGIALLVRGVTAMRSRCHGPLGYALYLQLLVFLYYLTQVSLVDAFVTSYGLIWGGLALLPFLVLHFLRGARYAGLPRSMPQGRPAALTSRSAGGRFNHRPPP